MKDTKHTPGPWKFRKFQAEEWPDKRWSVGPEKDGLSLAVCVSPRFFTDDPESEANARLIAAAPELLQMLQHAVELMEELKVGSHDIQVYKRVIQKATL